GLGALASGSRLASSGVYTLYLGMICLALAGAIIVRGESRPFWIGFAIFGWAYFLLAFETGSSSTPQRGWASVWLSGISYSNYNSDTSGGSHLITTEIIDFLEDHLTGSRSVGSKVMAQWTSGGYYSGTIQSYDGALYTIAWDDGSTPMAVAPAGIKGYTPYARLSGHSLFGALAGLLGGILAAGLFGPRPEKPEALRST
ncbi:MAG: hypothetical protein K8R36_06260, partial [Planctomycetales bacterium]|nr:hypothetical protein [Planctomycetales bacterium]